MINEDTKFWFQVLQWATTVGVWIYVWNVSRNRVTTEHITRVDREAKDNAARLEASIDQRHDNHADRLARLEQDARHAPSHEDLKRLHRRLDDMNGEMKEMRGEFHSANRTLSLIHQHLLDGGTK